MSQETSNISAPRKKICCTCLREFDETQQLCPVDMGLLTPLYFDNPSLGKTLGNSIKVKRLIAEGRVTRLLLCESEDGRLHCLRLLKRLEQRYVNAFLQEAQLLAQLDHRRLVRLYAAGTLGREPYMMLDFLAGGSLGDWLKHQQKLSFSQTARIVHQVCEALIYLDQEQVRYPILKPEHIMFLDNSHMEVCLIDLSQTYFAHDNRNVSIGGAIFLNPHFSAPELLMGREPTSKSNAYSVACLIHRCLTGNNVFGGQTDLQLASKHMSEKPEPVDWSTIGVPTDFEKVLLAGFDKSPQSRAGIEDFFSVAANYAGQ
jgi:eukaryotic-like serine/threonine-protein kinase